MLEYLLAGNLLLSQMMYIAAAHQPSANLTRHLVLNKVMIAILAMQDTSCSIITKRRTARFDDAEMLLKALRFFARFLIVLIRD